MHKELQAMKIFTSRGASALAVAAALSMVATPALARGWGGGYGHHRHHRDRVDAGDIFAGLLIIGGIAAVASAASKSQQQKRERDYRYPDGRYPDGDSRDDSPRYGDDRARSDTAPGSRASTGELGDAVDRCVAEVERGDRRVEQVDNASRNADGWRIDGEVIGGRDFTCTLDRELRIRQVTVDGRAA